MIAMKKRQLAIVLLDIIGSTAFVQRNDAMITAKTFQEHDKFARTLCYRFNGREIDRSDGFLLSFEHPIDAVNFALYYQRLVPARIGLQTRIGIHWGEVVEVKQEDRYVGAGAKKVELEGISKNIAARTMSVCGAGQVLLTEEVTNVIRGRTNSFTPKHTRYVCVGDYKFKGVRKPQRLYAVGETVESLKPPASSEKAKRISKKKKVVVPFSKMSGRERLLYLNVWFVKLSFAWAIYLLYCIGSSPLLREAFGLETLYWVELCNQWITVHLGNVFKVVK